MEFAAGAPLAWHVTLQSGALIELWADAYTTDEGAYVFSALVRATEAEQAELDVTARTPADPSRVAIAVARVPLTEVKNLHTAALRAVSGLCACPAALV
ncbi:hypothetical protein ACFV1L_08320 [Kitasatospora sp. NPDC059646]|uniref:hypothetical protein n=1 Tax=Kitasatospora sp. NPDC059646 TaxID=3346893 RepID=UPI0036B030FA